MSKVTPAGVVSTFASGFNGPVGLAFDAAGNLTSPTPARHGEQGNARGRGQHLRLRVRRTLRPGLRLGRQPLRRQRRRQHGEQGDARGVVSTFASGFSGPVGLAFDSAGNLYVSNAATAR